MEPNNETAFTFTNDQLTDLILHKEDTPVIQNGEIINEPEDVQESAVETEVDENECHFFPIHFNFGGIDYTADVQKAKNLFEEYHITGVQPAIDHLPEPYIIARHFADEKFDFPVNETYYPQLLGYAVIKAIHDGSSEDAKANFF